MSTTLKARLYFAATQNPGLSALLLTGSPGVFNWYDLALPQGSTFPAVVVKLISDSADYAVTGRMPTSWARVQFEVYGTGNDPQNANLVVSALESFLDTFNGTGIAGNAVYPNQIVGGRDGAIAQTQPLTYLRFVDARIFWNSAI